MNQFFSLRRFAQMNRWFWAANGRTYSLALLALLTITTLMLGRVLVLDGYDAGIVRNNIPYFLILLVPAVSLLSTHVVSVLHDQSSAILYLMIPASRAEKFAVVLSYLLLLLVGYSFFYVATEALLLQIANSRLPATGRLYKSELLGTATERWQEPLQTAYFLSTICVLNLVGSLYFRQGVLVKNIVLILCLFFSLTLVYKYILSVFFPGQETHVSNFFLLGDLYVTTTPGTYAGALKLPPAPFIKYVFPWLALVTLWITARIRFSEIER